MEGRSPATLPCSASSISQPESVLYSTLDFMVFGKKLSSPV